MADPQLTHTDRATTIAFDASLLVEGKLLVCLMQMLPTVPNIAMDQGRPGAVAVIQQLLTGGEAHGGAILSEMAPGGDPVLIIAPEFAFGSGDWGALDAAIRQSARPLVVIAGFGATPGHVLLDWKAAVLDGVATRRHFAWDQQVKAIGGVRPVNGGWCWVHQPVHGTDCVVYLKSVAEQNVEAVALADLQFGSGVTHLRFNDVDLFPLICADMLQPVAEHADSAQARIREVLNGIDMARPAMVIGSLLQHGYNVNWESAIDSLLNQVMANRPGLVTLCNIAHDKPVADENYDRWRSLSGVYGKWGDLTKGQANLPVGRRLNVRGVVGAVVRRSEPIVASGPVDWGPYGPVDGKFVWHSEMVCATNQEGLVAPLQLPAQPHGCEIARFLRRHPAEAGWSPRLNLGLERVSTHVASDENPSGARLLNSLLGGVDPAKADPDALHEVEVAAVAALHGLATLSAIETVNWQTDPRKVGQLTVAGANRHILVWRDPIKSAGQMRSDLGAWRQNSDPHPDLVVIASSRFGDLDAGLIGEHRRDDVSQAPPAKADLGLGVLAAETKDISLARAHRNVAAIGLARVSQIYADYDETVGDGALVAKLLADIAGLFAEGAAA